MNVSELVKKYKSLHLEDVIDYTAFNKIAVSHHSTKIEGSTLTPLEAQILLKDGLSPKNRPMQDVLMVIDHAAALDFVLNEAKNKSNLSVKFIQDINALVMKSTGKIYQTAFGEIDSAKGLFRKGAVFAGSSYFPSFDKVERMTGDLIEEINNAIKQPLSVQEQLNLSFDAHFKLVSIHPFYDGNGRTSRLLMNYLQAFYDLPPAIVDSSDRQAYFEALIAARRKDDLTVFRKFMEDEYIRYLTDEIEKFEQANGQEPERS